MALGRTQREWLYTCHERQAFKLAVDNLRDFVLFFAYSFSLFIYLTVLIFGDRVLLHSPAVLELT